MKGGFSHEKKILLTLLALGFAFVVFVSPVSAGLGWTTANKVGYAFWDDGPHYGAFFPGSNGSHQYFSGPSGSPPGYSSWDWWGQALNVLLLEKRWLFTHSDGWVANYHHAYMLGW